MSRAFDTTDSAYNVWIIDNFFIINLCANAHEQKRVDKTNTYDEYRLGYASMNALILSPIGPRPDLEDN